MANTPLTYKGKPLVRKGNELYYGDMADKYIIYMQIMSTTEQDGQQVADKVKLFLMSTDLTKSPMERIVKSSDKKGLFGALEYAAIWLERMLKEQA